MAGHDRNATGILSPASVPAADAVEGDHEHILDDLDIIPIDDYAEPTLEVDTFEQRVESLLAVARRTSFFPLVSMLERVMGEAVRIGGDGPPAMEAIRFRHDPALTFSAGDVTSAIVKRIPLDPSMPFGATRPVVEIVTTFLGLTGATTPMPLYLAEEVNHEDETNVRRDFLDIFHHRLVSVLYRAVMRYSLAREHRVSEQDLWMERVLSLSGLDPATYVTRSPARFGGPQKTAAVSSRPSEQGFRSAIPLGVLLRLAPLIGRRARGARAVGEALNILVEGYLTPEASLRLEEYAGDWVPIDNDQQCCLGQRNNVLGHHAMLGGKVFDRSNRFQVVIGPLDSRGRNEFSPAGKGLRVLREGMRLLVRESLDYDVELHMTEGATKPFRLFTPDPSRLGTDCRLGTGRDGEVVRLRNVGRIPLKPYEAVGDDFDEDLLFADL